MDMELMDMYRRPYASLEMQTFNGHQQQHHGQPHGQHIPYWNHHLMALYQQHQQRAAAVMMGQGGINASKQTEPKPRLAKDEVELLEREFSKNPKPNSSTKRELAEQMGVEVPRINNWFQNRRAKEKQMRKTAEFEAQQARERAASESKSPDEQDRGVVSEFYGLSNHHQPLGLSTAAFGDDNDDDNDEDQDGNDDAHSEQQHNDFCEPPAADVSDSISAPPGQGTPASSESDGLVHVEYKATNSPPTHHTNGISELAPPAIISNSFTAIQNHVEFQRPAPYGFGLTESPLFDGLPANSFESFPSHHGILRDSGSFGSYSDREYFASSHSRFSSHMMSEGAIESGDHESPDSQGLLENLVKPDDMSPRSMPDSPPQASDLRFKSPPPPADIASRRNMRRPAPLGLSSLRNGTHGYGPKTGIDAPRRSDTASPIRRISSATGSLPGRVQKSFMNSGGPRSPFALDRNKEALLQSLHNTHSPIMTSLNSAMSPMSPEGMSGQGLRENTVGTNTSDEDQGYTFGSLGAVSMYKVESSIKTPPGTPGLPIHFHDPFFSNSVDHAWNYVPQDEPLPTPSLCSHGGSELEFSMAPQMPGYVASQPVTPSFPPSVGPTYNGFFNGNMTNAEYNFPDSYPPETSARSSPGGPPFRSKQFQFAQNITPQDFNTDK
ncbi:hypothetical protein B0T17DRAFT_592285 [Bombardia bombarda]|uniref:Homeobox domain-containing protein n=1 Tax=Bombardia bombarda TaxID=252184 RepID=A0AA40BYN9_9PEZI|nr:hypothetical protein B0T17DRAFT_592285 [Bombardia bombarda]